MPLASDGRRGQVPVNPQAGVILKHHRLARLTLVSFPSACRRLQSPRSDFAARYSTRMTILADRQAIVEIVRQTKKGLPEYFQAVRQ